MTSPIAVLLVIGPIYLGPWVATEDDLSQWAYIDKHTIIEDTKFSRSFKWDENWPWPKGADGRLIQLGNHERLCRKAMAAIGVRWRQGIDGADGWLTIDKQDRWNNRYTSVDVSCKPAPLDFRKSYDSDEIKPGLRNPGQTNEMKW